MERFSSRITTGRMIRSKRGDHRRGSGADKPLESGIAATLPPGLYTALLAGANNGTGIGVVEVYDRGATP